MDKGKSLNGLAYILPKILKAEKVIKYWNGDIVEGEVINIAIFKDQIVIRTYRDTPTRKIEKSLVINKE